MCARAAVHENETPGQIRYEARITRIDAGAPRNTGCPAAVAAAAAAARSSIVRLVFSRGLDFFDLKGALIPIPRARPRSTADSRRAAPLCYSRAPCSNLPLKNRRYPAITFSGHRKSETHTHIHGPRLEQWTRHSFFLCHRQRPSI